ncbi:hypothetical protein NS226_17390 [Aureimonas ureilytica]|uniref:Type IV secretion system coupling protein TraD DNA-binding domain-containing protein n=1 Tax=Aureimonas ureilytica TaxID=401562 RepID=A0A175R4T5_9HYPH|nr:type IV secretion system DNA-binding domain-containing protein [Aureimonas ureilytica]KTQ88022.1 hypothetical protein NS226_17390 [Aureimonas ureilytica]
MMLIDACVDVARAINPFADLHVGYNPRRQPDRAIRHGMAAGLLAALSSLAMLLALTPIPTLRGPIYAIFAPARLLDDLAYRGVVAVWERFWTALLIGIWIGWRTSRRIWRDTPRTEPFTQPDDADPKLFRDELAEIGLNAAFAREAGMNTKPGFAIAPHIVVPPTLENRNMMVLAASGAGKSNIVRPIAQQAIERGDIVVLHCTKGDVTRSLRMEDVILVSPTHRDGWAIDLASIEGPAAVADFAASIIKATDQPFFSDTARLVFADIVMTVIAEHGRNWDARTLLSHVLSEPDEIRARIDRIDLSASPFLAGNSEDGVSRTVEGIIDTMIAGALTTLRPMAYAWSQTPPEKRFSVKRALSPNWTGPKVIIVQSHPDFPDLSASVCGFVLRQICRAVAAPQPSGRARPKVTMVLDEFASMGGRIDGIERSLSVAREHNMTTVIALQSIWQLRQIYGDAAELISDLFQIKIYGRHVAGEAAERVVRDLGKRKIHGTKLNYMPEAKDKRRTVAFEADLPILSTTQLGRILGLFHPLTNRETIRAVLHFAGDAYLLDWPPTRWTRRSEGYVAASWTRTVPNRRNG